MTDITLRQLAFLAEVGRGRSLAAAAAVLHLTPPAVAQQLRRLERTVGLPLLERRPGGQFPTAAGQALIDAHAGIEAELRACLDQLDALRAAGAGHVAVAAVSTAKYFVAHVLAAFRRTHPGVEVTMAIGNRDEVLAMLRDYSVDLAIMGRPPAGLDVVQEVFGDHPYVVVAAPDHPLAGVPRIPLARVAAETFLVREPGSGTRLHLEALFSPLDLQPTVGMEIASNETIKQAVMAGLGLALISAHTVAAEVHDGRLAVLDVEGLPIHRHWLVVRQAHRATTPAGLALWDFVLAEATSHLPVLDVGSVAPVPARQSERSRE